MTKGIDSFFSNAQVVNLGFLQVRGFLINYDFYLLPIMFDQVWGLRSGKSSHRNKCLTVILTLLLCSLNHAAVAPQPITVRVDRWLAVRQAQGPVSLRQQGRVRTVRTGDRLQAVGDRLITGKRATAVLEVDAGIGLIQVAENTQVEVRSLGVESDNGRTTTITVPYGQVRLRLRPFTHRSSVLEVQTPAGVSAVRGTEFGVAVQANGKTGLATLTGSVAAIAQSSSVFVPGGFQNLTLPGESPSPAVPLKEDTQLRYQLERQIQHSMRRFRLLGQVDPVNLVFVGDTPQDTDRNGRFTLSLPATTAQMLQITVVTPLGRRQTHEVQLRF